MTDKAINEIYAELERELTEEEKIICFYSNLEILRMRQNAVFSCAYFGSSKIDKLEFVLAFFRKFDLKEYDGEKGDYIILKGKNITGDYDSLVKAFRETKDIPFVIVMQSEAVLNNDDNILLIKHLNEYNRRFNSGSNSFSVTSKYIFLSDFDCLENVSAERKNVFYELVRTITGQKN